MTDNAKLPRKKIVKKQAAPDLSGKLDLVAIELRRAREAKGLSHSDLHRQTGISRPVLFGYEAGRTKPGARELRLLSEALGVSPNRLLFGTEEPFKPQPGLRSLVKLRNSPVMFMAMLMVLPISFAVLDDDQVESLLVIFASMVEARDKDAYNKLSVMVEIFTEEIGNGTPEEISAFSKRGSDPAFQAGLTKRYEDRIKNMG